MTIQQIKNKIAELDYWLTNNPHHKDRNIVANDKRVLELRLMHLESPNL